MSPTLYLDPARALAALDYLRQVGGPLRVRYAVKANPHPALLHALAAADAHFGVTTAADLLALQAANVPGARIACLTPGPPASLLRACRGAGVACYAADSIWELRKLAALVPRAAVLLTLATPPAGRLRYPAARVGAALDELPELLAAARALPLDLRGVAFHVGSQCERLAPWRDALRRAAVAWQQLAAHGYRPRVLNAGGGLPVPYRGEVPMPAEVAHHVLAAIDRHYSPPPAEIWWEPGRFLAANTGLLRATVLDVTSGRAGRRRPIVQVDLGRHHGLPEAALGIRYGWLADRPGPRLLTTLVGPLGPAADLLDRAALLPPLSSGDSVWLPHAGAYTTVQTAYPSAYAAEVVLGPLPHLAEPRRAADSPDPLANQAGGRTEYLPA